MTVEQAIQWLISLKEAIEYTVEHPDPDRGTYIYVEAEDLEALSVALEALEHS